MPNVTRSIALVVVLLLVTACSGPPAASPAAPSTSGSPAASGAPEVSASDDTGVAGGAAVAWLPEWAEAADIPDEIANRRPMPFCGVEKAPAPQPMEFIDRAVRLCFWNAAQSRAEAEFVSIQTTMEGDPLAVVYRLSADGTVEVFTDFTQDRFGGGAWQVSTCQRVVEGEGAALVGVDGCGESRTPR